MSNLYEFTSHAIRHADIDISIGLYMNQFKGVSLTSSLLLLLLASCVKCI